MVWLVQVFTYIRTHIIAMQSCTLLYTYCGRESSRVHQVQSQFLLSRAYSRLQN